MKRDGERQFFLSLPLQVPAALAPVECINSAQRHIRSGLWVEETKVSSDQFMRPGICLTVSHLDVTVLGQGCCYQAQREGVRLTV